METKPFWEIFKIFEKFTKNSFFQKQLPILSQKYAEYNYKYTVKISSQSTKNFSSYELNLKNVVYHGSN